MNAVVNGLTGLGLGATVASCQPGGIDWLSEPCNAILAGIVSTPGTLTAAQTGGGGGGVTTGPHPDVPGTNALLPASDPNAPAAWPPKNIAVLRSLGYNCLPVDWAQPVDGILPYCAAGQSPNSAIAGPVLVAVNNDPYVAPSGGGGGSSTPPGTNAGGGTSQAYSGPQGVAFTTSGGSQSVLQVGDSWTIQVQGAPNTPVTISASVSGGPVNTTPVGNTDASGLLTLHGSVTTQQIGAWREDYFVGSAHVGTLAFTVPAPTTGSGTDAAGSGTGTGTTPDTSLADTTVLGMSLSTLLLLGAGAFLLFSGGKKGGH